MLCLGDQSEVVRFQNEDGRYKGFDYQGDEERVSRSFTNPLTLVVAMGGDRAKFRWGAERGTVCSYYRTSGDWDASGRCVSIVRYVSV